jgi:hypothetical protein
MIRNSVLGEWFDGASKHLRENLGALEGISGGTLWKIDHISRATQDGPTPNDTQATLAHERLVLLALAENALTRQQAGVSKSRKAS